MIEYCATTIFLTYLTTVAKETLLRRQGRMMERGDTVKRNSMIFKRKRERKNECKIDLYDIIDSDV